MVHFGNLTLICGSFTSAIFIYSPHRGQEHQIVRITLKPNYLEKLVRRTKYDSPRTSPPRDAPALLP
ncbi:hypothetical protein JCGZ_22854 [Jatropha curcas]|uniref:Uncharacterized protein n=1 Tax=Jatropha curcas TaxID=180498 RepID=A0A067K303_JATCU|nr:hypothetical protein JCGZ_22854 [Jatropha curcas]